MTSKPQNLTAEVFLPQGLSPDFPAILHDEEPRNLRGRSNARAPHVHHMFEIGSIHKGHANFFIAGKYLEFPAGSICVVTHAEPHLAFFPVNCSCSWLYLDVPRLLLGSGIDAAIIDASSLAGLSFTNVFNAKEYPRLQAITKDLIREFRERSIWFKENIKASLVSFFIELKRLEAVRDWHFSTAKKAAQPAPTIIDTISPAIDYMHAHFGDPLDCSELANMVCMSETNFRRVFKKVIGNSPYDYLTAYRVTMSCGMLRSRSSRIEKVARDCGFEDPSSFRRSFRKRIGMSPAEWKRDYERGNNG